MSKKKQSLPKFLLDANLSFSTASHLKSLGLNVRHASEFDLTAASDEEIIRAAKRTKRILITLDLEFGEIYHLKEKGKFGVIILRLKNQTVESVNALLGSFLKTNPYDKLPFNSLVVLTETRIRIVRMPS